MKKIFITGITSGIGRGLAQYYLKQGCMVYGLSRRKPDYESELLVHKQVDLTEYEKVNEALNEMLSKEKQIDLVVLNAGVLGEISTIKEASVLKMKEVMDLNLWAQKNLLDQLISSTEIKQVVAISSGASRSANKGWSGYSLSKGALNLLMKLYASENESIHFSALAPGLVDTAMQDYLCSDFQKSDEFSSIQKIRTARNTAQMPSPFEFAPKFALVVDQLLKFETGSFIDIRKL